VGESPLFLWRKAPSLAFDGMALDLDKIRIAAERVAASHGLEVVEIEFVPSTKHRALRVFVEKNAVERAKLAETAKLAGEDAAAEEGLVPAAVATGTLAMDQLAWVTHEDCERFSVDFGTLADVEDLVPGSEYTLEVSSPGLERKLYGHADYERFRGSLVKVQTFQPVEGNRHWQGRLTEVADKTIVVDLSAVRQKGKNKKIVAQTIALELANIEKAQLVAEI
jgi:ribosome maturation factor RimP